MSSETPICDALFGHLRRSRGALHVPGHQQGSVFPAILNPWFGSALKLDVTELQGLDNLAQPEECIRLSEQLAASYYGSEQCLYSVNGSSAGVMAALLTAASPAATILLVNAFHISAWYGLVHSGANALRLPPHYSPDGREIPVDVETVRQMLTAHPEVQVVYLTSPTYQGDCSPVEDIANLVHSRGLTLIVDEAHGAHFGLIPQFPQNSVDAGADIVIQSVHKMLPALTQTAWVHRQGHRVEATVLANSLRSLQTSSPSYLLLASLDAAQHWLRSEGPSVARKTVSRLQQHGILHDNEIASPVRQDPLKHWVAAPSRTAAAQLHQQLLARGLYVEYVDDMGVLSILGLNLREQVLRDYADVLQQWHRGLENPEGAGRGCRHHSHDTMDDGSDKSIDQKSYWELLTALGASTVEFMVSPRTAAALHQERVPLAEAVGRLSAAPLSPYPPGVPVLYPGQLLTREIVGILQAWVDTGRKIQGIHGHTTIAVLCDE